MSDKKPLTPRVFIARHGETEWTLSGQCTGKTDLPLTENGERQVRDTGEIVVGTGKLLDPSRFAHVFVSPRQRAQRTFELLVGPAEKDELVKSGRVTVTEDIAEWDYGDYEGIHPAGIRARRKESGLDQIKPWDIWVDGCEGGESPEQVCQRLDRLIQRIRDIQGPHIKGSISGDILLVAHGHILRAFTKRWLRYPMDFSFTMMMDPGAIGILSYAHHNLSEPAILIGTNFPQQKNE